MQDSFKQKKTAPLVNAAPPLVILTGVVCELYAQYQVAILYFCTDKSLF